MKYSCQTRSAISRKGKCIQSAPHVPARIAVLQPPRENLIERRSRNHAQLSQTRDRLRQPPIGDARTHAALNNYRFLHVLIIHPLQAANRISFVTLAACN